MNKILKLVGLNLGIAMLNIVLFSPGLLNIQLTGSNVLASAAGFTAMFMSLVVLVYGNFKLLSQKERAIQVGDLKSAEDCMLALKQCYGKKTFDNDIAAMLDQVEGLVKKKEKIMDILLQRFSIVDKSYDRFKWTIFDVEQIFYANIQSILNKINAFDEEDYERVRSDNAEKRFSMKYIASKLSIYNEYISFVKSAMEDNDKIILKLDGLLLELSKYNSVEAGEIDNMNEIKEMDELIKKSKYYN